MAVSKLRNAAITALRDYMGLDEEETLLVVSDPGKKVIGYELYQAGLELCSEAFYVEMKEREINGQEPPEAIARIMKEVDVVVCPTTRSLTHTAARREASKLGIRVGTMPGITEETMIRCLSGDYEELLSLTDKVATCMNRVSEIHLETKLGTDLKMEVKNRRVISSTGVLRNIGEGGNIPSGEVYLAPLEGKSNGKLVVDGSIAGIGLIKNPVTLEISDGFITKIICKGPEGQMLESMLSKCGNNYAFAVAEFGIGTNPHAELCGDILEDEKVLGTVHVAFGNNLSMGGKINVPVHVDCIMTRPYVHLDGEKLMQNGTLYIGGKQY